MGAALPLGLVMPRPTGPRPAFPLPAGDRYPTRHVGPGWSLGGLNDRDALALSRWVRERPERGRLPGPIGRLGPDLPDPEPVDELEAFDAFHRWADSLGRGNR